MDLAVMDLASKTPVENVIENKAAPAIRERPCAS
jgi:hypothetical protein